MMHLQPSLFPDELPEGLSYFPDYLTSGHALELVAIIDALPWRSDLKRRVQHYGYRYDYKSRSALKSDYLGQLPEWLIGIAEKLHSDGHFDNVPDQVIVNEYMPGQGIAAHVDCVPCFGKEIGSISLLSGCIMRFTERKSVQTIDQYLAPESLALMQGPSRYDWTHGIASRKSDIHCGQKILRSRRVSLTFRVMQFHEFEIS